jgi:SAM-dependent methyltransferase
MTRQAPPASKNARGLHRLLEVAAVYEGFQRLLGASATRARFSREFIRASPVDRVLDIGCGVGGMLDYLPRDITYVGYDANAGYIRAARRRYGDRGRFVHAAIGEIDGSILGSDFDLVIAKAILHHLDDATAAALIDGAYALLRPGGTLVTIDPVRHEGQSWVALLLIALDRGRAIRTASAYQRLLARSFAQAETWLLTDAARFPYSYFIARMTKQ